MARTVERFTAEKDEPSGRYCLDCNFVVGAFRLQDIRGGVAEFRQSGFVQIIPKRGEDSKKLAAALNREKAVWKAYVAPRPVPAGLSGSSTGTRLFEPAQGYLYSAPFGIGAADVWGLAGAKGKGITICR